MSPVSPAHKVRRPAVFPPPSLLVARRVVDVPRSCLFRLGTLVAWIAPRPLPDPRLFPSRPHLGVHARRRLVRIARGTPRYRSPADVSVDVLDGRAVEVTAGESFRLAHPFPSSSPRPRRRVEGEVQQETQTLTLTFDPRATVSAPLARRRVFRGVRPRPVLRGRSESVPRPQPRGGATPPRETRDTPRRTPHDVPAAGPRRARQAHALDVRRMFRLASTGARRRVGCRPRRRRGRGCDDCEVTTRTVLRRVVRATRRTSPSARCAFAPATTLGFATPPAASVCSSVCSISARWIPTRSRLRRYARVSPTPSRPIRIPRDASFRIPEKYLGMSRAVNGIASPPRASPSASWRPSSPPRTPTSTAWSTPRDDISARGCTSARPCSIIRAPPRRSCRSIPGASSACTPWKISPRTRRFVSRTRNCTPLVVRVATRFARRRVSSARANGASTSTGSGPVATPPWTDGRARTRRATDPFVRATVRTPQMRRATRAGRRSRIPRRRPGRGSGPTPRTPRA